MKFTIDDTTELRQLQLEDANELFSLVQNNKQHLAQWLPWVEKTNSVADSRNFIQSTIEKYEKNNELECGIWHNGELIGVIGFRYIDKKDRKTELGYWLGKNYQGKGLMTKAVKVFLQYSFEELKLHRVQILAALENKKSQAIPERLGFTKEGVLREDGWLYDRFVDLVIYSLLEKEYTITKS